ncbi:MAG TPA: hypothetical protein VJ583_03535 [Nitrososphaeraceae archaeon]|nr:hypothetical protein [Nitrososphaeraceae archaeon]
MPTNKVKFRMQKEAKRIVGILFNPYIAFDVENNNRMKFISFDDLRKKEIDETLEKYPEFNPDSFRQMVKEFSKRNKEKRERNEQ